MGMVPSNYESPTPEMAAALKEAAERGSLSHPERLQAEIAAFQEKLPARAPSPTVGISRAEEQFQQDLEFLAEIADTASELQTERLARATHSALVYLAGQK